MPHQAARKRYCLPAQRGRFLPMFRSATVDRFLHEFRGSSRIARSRERTLRQLHQRTVFRARQWLPLSRKLPPHKFFLALRPQRYEFQNSINVVNRLSVAWSQIPKSRSLSVHLVICSRVNFPARVNHCRSNRASCTPDAHNAVPVHDRGYRVLFCADHKRYPQHLLAPDTEPLLSFHIDRVREGA